MTRVIALVCAVVVLGFGAFMVVDRQGSTPSDPLLAGSLDAQEADIDTSGIIEMQLGNPDSPVTLIEYASYTCPHCATFHTGAYKQLKADYIDTGKINFVYREVYFDRYGLWASAIARCGGPEKFFGITDLIYQSQSEWARAGGPAEIVAELRKIARLAGIENDQLEACLQDGEKMRTLVAWYQENVEEDGIESTPSFVLNGQRFSNMPYTEMAALIDEALGN